MKRVCCCRVCYGPWSSVAMLVLVAWLLVSAARSASFLGWRLAHLDAAFVSATAVALGLVTTGLWLGAKSHGRADPLMVGIVAALSTFFGVLAWPPAAVLGVIGVAWAVVANQWLLRRSAGHAAAS